MTPKTAEHYHQSCANLAAVTTGIQLGSYEAIHLFMDPMIHLLVLEGLKDLSAVITEEGTLGEGAVNRTAGANR